MSNRRNYPGDTPPIPTYEEATSSRPHTSHSFQGSHEISADAERQGLLGTGTPHNARGIRRDGDGTYHSAGNQGRSSLDSDLTLPDDGSEEDGGLRRAMEEMEVLDPAIPLGGRRRRLLPKRFADLTYTISSIQLPSVRFPSFSPLTSRLASIRAHVKPSWSWPILGRVVALLAVLAVVYGLVVVRIFTWKVVPQGTQYLPEVVRTFVQKTVDPAVIEKYLWEISYDDHVAGTKGDYFLAEWVEARFKEAELDGVYNDDYEVYLNYPRANGRRVAIVSPPNLVWEAALEEDVVEDKSGQHQVPVFHGYSRSGNITGPLIYANYGSREDYALLKSRDIDLTGSIVLVRYYGSQGDRALKVKDAELAGAAGCLIYSDPMDDGFAKGTVWPDGPWRTRDSVQRGSVGLTSWVVGDALTPGWASIPGADRVSKDNNPGLTNIPSLPLAWRDAQVLLQSLKGHGKPVPAGWAGAVPDISEWWTGSITTSPIVQLMNLQDEIDRQPIRNVIGKIDGVETPDKIIYVGNHRDAWCYGAVDPGSGTAVLLEVVRVFGELLQRGWRPRRTIVFASWDGEEYNLIGSTEHVENRIDAIRANGVAYLNVDVGVSGGQFRAAGSPLFERLLLRTLDRVNDPSGNATLLESWNETKSKLQGLGAGSDYVAFQDLAGCSSIDFGFEGPENGYPYHSCYESFDWMQKFGDPNFQRHAALAQVWLLLILELADDPLLGYDFNTYAKEVTRYISDLKDAATMASGEGGSKLNTRSLEDAAQYFVDSAAEFMQFGEKWENAILRGGLLESHEWAAYRISQNARMSNFDTHLLDLPSPKEGRVGGIPGRTQFKHVIFGPQTSSGYDAAYFPAITDAMEAQNWIAAQEQLEIVARTLKHAAHKLLH